MSRVKHLDNSEKFENWFAIFTCFTIFSICNFCIQVSPIKYVRDGNLAVKSLFLKDNSTVAKVCLFDKLAENEYAEGNNLQITAVYPKKYLGVEQLTSTAFTKCQVDNN